MDVTIYSSNASEFEGEGNLLKEIAGILKDAEPVDKSVCMITNVLLGTTHLDCLLLTEKGPILINCEPYQGQIMGSDNGGWTVLTPEGNVVEMLDNPFETSRNNRFTFLRKWRHIVGTHFTNQIPVKQILHFSSWVYFRSGSQHLDDRFDYSKVKWFNVVTRENLVSQINGLNRQYRISKTGYDKILKEFGLVTVDSGDLTLKSEEDGVSDQSHTCIIHEVQTLSGPITVIHQKKPISIIIPSRTQCRTRDFVTAFDEALIHIEAKNYERALQLIDFALQKDHYDREGQDLKFTILCLLGREDEAEEYLIRVLKK